MDKQLVFKCKISGYFIEYIMNDEIAYINMINCDFTQVKLFMHLIRSSIDELKNKNIKKISQTIDLNEWKENVEDKTTFELVKIDNQNNICDIQCDIDDFLENFGIVLGL